MGSFISNTSHTGDVLLKRSFNTIRVAFKITPIQQLLGLHMNPGMTNFSIFIVNSIDFEFYTLPAPPGNTGSLHYAISMFHCNGWFF